MSYYIPLSKRNYRENKNLEIQGLKHNMKNLYTPESINLEHGYIPDRMTSNIARKDTKLIYDDILHNPQDINFLRSIQGTGKSGMPNKVSGMAKYKKQAVPESGMPNNMSGGMRNISATILKHMFLNPLKKGIKQEMERPYNENIRGGKMLKDYTPQELEAVNQQRLEDSIWRKSKQGKEYINNLNELTPAEKMANIKKVGREYQADMKRQNAKAEHDYAIEQLRLAAKKEANKSIWDTIANEGFNALASIIPGGKLVQTVAKEGLKQGYKALRGHLGESEFPQMRQPQGGRRQARKQSPAQLAHQHKIKMVREKYGLSFKEALMKIGRHNKLMK